MDEFERDLAENMRAIDAARASLVQRVRQLTDDDLGRTRRGGWSVREVLRHVIESEISYTKVLAFLRGAPMDVAAATPDDVASASAAVSALERYRAILLASFQGVDEATFYEMRSLGHDQYSVISVLENIASHDHEHLEQIEKTSRS
jgi:uncharacterized damage-inducible protein DinB